MGLYDWMAKYVKGHTNLRRIYLAVIAILLLTIVKKPWNFQNSMIEWLNTPLPWITSYSVGFVLYIFAIIGLLGFWRTKL